jgi:signal peptidase II
MTDEDKDPVEDPASASDAKTKDAAALAAVKGGPPRQRRLLELAAVVAGVLGVDLWTKAWAWDALRDGEVITIVENWFYFEFGFNTGAAFSFLRDGSYARMTFIVVTLAALLYMARLAATLPTRFRSAFVAVALVTGGALGNLHDRLFRVMELRGEMRHGVVDFIKVYYWPGKVWPTFNVADVALVVGVGLLFIFLTRHGDALDAAKAAAKKAAEAEPR